MIDIKDAYRRSNKNEAKKQILRTKARRECFKYRNMERDAQLTRLVDGSSAKPLPPVRRLQGRRNDVKTLTQLALWCKLPVGTLQNLVAWGLKRFGLFPGYAEHDDAFARLNDAKYTRFVAAVLPVAHFQSDDTEVHVVRCTGAEPSRIYKPPRNDDVLLWPDHGVEGNFLMTHGRIPARLRSLFLIEESHFDVQICMALVQTFVPSPIRQPSGMITVSAKQQVERADELNVRRRPHFAVGTTYVVPLKAIERAAHLCPYSAEADNTRWFLNNTIDLNAFNLLVE